MMSFLVMICLFFIALERPDRSSGWFSFASWLLAVCAVTFVMVAEMHGWPWQPSDLR